MIDLSAMSFRDDDVDTQKQKTLFGKDKKSVATSKRRKDKHKSTTKPDIVIKERILNTFTVEGDIDRVTSAGNDQAWVWGFGYAGLQLVTSKGKVAKTVETRFLIRDVVVDENGVLLLTLYASGKVVRFTPSEERFKDVYMAEGYTTSGIALTDTGNIIVGLHGCPMRSKLIEITKSGREIRTFQYDSVHKGVLVVDPVSICTNRNGDIVVIDFFEDVVAIDQNGKERFRYYGTLKGLESTFIPQCVVTDKLGHIIISDNHNSALHLLNKDGVFLQYLLNRPYEVRSLSCICPKKHKCFRPKGLTIERSGKLWLYCYGNKIKRVEYL